MKKLKQTLLFCFLLASITSFGQKEKWEEKKNQIETQKIAYITSKINLTPKEAEVFWPLYNQMQKERDVLTQEHGKSMKKIHDGDINTMSDEELTKIANSEFEFEQKMLDLKKKYHSEFLKVISIKKIVLLEKAEHEFRKELLKKLKDK